MELKDFDFHLPEELIAQRPLPERDSSRLMVLSRGKKSVEHKLFRDILQYLKKGDLLVLNDTRVIPTRLTGVKPTGGRVELLLVERLAGGGGEEWKCLAKPTKGLKAGSLLLFEGIEAEVTGFDDEGLVRCAFNGRLDLKSIGKVPLPPYIKREPGAEDSSRYQTVFAGNDGAVAAPTAGLHFTLGLLEEIRARGVEVRTLTLHTGPGTFMPVRVDNIKEHRMMKEYYKIDEQAFGDILKAKKEGRRVITVGTTSTRALEASVADGFDAPVLEGRTGLFIYPGFRFRMIDALLTNFHLPGSTLIMLVAAFAGHGFLMDAYREAVARGYRFFSYGDAMLIE